MYALEVAITISCKQPRKKHQRQGAQIPRNEAYISIRRNDEGCRTSGIRRIYLAYACPANAGDFLRGRQ